MLQVFQTKDECEVGNGDVVGYREAPYLKKIKIKIWQIDKEVYIKKVKTTKKNIVHCN